MKQEDKELLLKDLCARLPYRLRVHYKTAGWEDKNGILTPQMVDNMLYRNDIIIKPYLRSMSSMTEKEKWELVNLCDFYQCYCDTDDYSHYGIEIISQYCVNDKLIPEDIVSCRAIDWLYAHHFDIRGLIEKGLAIAVTENNDPYK